MRISDWSSDVCSSDLTRLQQQLAADQIKFGFLRLVEGVGRSPVAATVDHALAEHGAVQFVADVVMALPDREAAATALFIDQQRAQPRPNRSKAGAAPFQSRIQQRSEEHTSELQSLMRRPYAVFC